MRSKLLVPLITIMLITITGCESSTQTPIEKAISSCSIFIKTLSLEVAEPKNACTCFVNQNKKTLNDKDFNFLLDTMIGKEKLKGFSMSIEKAHSEGLFPKRATAISVYLMECL